MSLDPLPLALETESGEPVRVLALRGRERVSRLFRFDLEVVSSAASELLGARAALVLSADGAVVRRVFGVVDAVLTRDVEGPEHARVRLVPRAVRLQRRRTKRIFQDRTTLQIAAQLLAEWGLPLRLAVARPLPPRPYSVQYDETDLAYLQRLFAEEGLFFAFEHGEGFATGETLVVADRAAELAPIAGDPRLVFEPAAAGAASRVGDGVVFERAARVRQVPSGARVRGYDHRRPSLALEDAAGAARLPDPSGLLARETLDYDEASYEDDLPPRPAWVALEAAGARASEVRVGTYCPRLEVLRRVVVDGDAEAWVVAALEHEAYGGEQVPAGKVRYRNRARLAPASLPPRPPRPPDKPRQTTETAVVVGPPGAELHTDELGRVQVRFPWDRAALPDHQSAWLRVLTPWAGPGWGAQFTPRVGMEVLVTFIAGDLDRPVCAGALPNVTTPPPFVGVTSGVRTRSTPDGAASNELSFDDTKGSERLYLQASRDLVEVVASTRQARVGGERQAEVAGADRLTVGASRSVETAGDHRRVTGRDDELRVHGTRRVDVAGSAELQVHGDASEHVGGDRVVLVRGRSSLVVGDPERPVHRLEQVHGSMTVGADGLLELASTTGIVLRCGDTRLELRPDRAILSAAAVELSAAEELAVRRADGPALRLGDEAELLSKALRIFTDGGALELDREFRVKGDAVRLGYDPSRPSHDNAAEDAETVKLELLLSNADLEPLADCQTHAWVGSRRIEGKTSGEGKLSLEVPKDTRSVALRVWERDYPTGPALSYAIAVGEAIPVSTPRGQKLRLKNLGYYHGAIDDAPDAALEDAVREFQADHADSHDLTPTGRADGPTEGALEDVHGS